MEIGDLVEGYGGLEDLEQDALLDELAVRGRRRVAVVAPRDVQLVAQLRQLLPARLPSTPLFFLLNQTKEGFKGKRG